jgi:phosphatidate cytidylyltransferase
MIELRRGFNLKRSWFKPRPADAPGPAGSPRGARSARWGDLRLRLLSAAVLIPLAIGCIWTGGGAFTTLVSLMAVGLAFEWLGFCGQRTVPMAIFVFAALPLSVVLTASGWSVPALAVLAIATGAGAMFAHGLSPARPLAFGIPYLGLGAVALVWLRQPPASGGANVMVLLLVVWASDIGAYVAGRAIGGPRMAPTISPGKTWSGAAGGLFAATAMGSAASALLCGGPPSWRALIFALVIGLVGQIGDLFESQLKRHFGVKDSGSIIPGHGGLLDRLDAVLTAAPAAALLALTLGRGVVLWE